MKLSEIPRVVKFISISILMIVAAYFVVISPFFLLFTDFRPFGIRGGFYIPIWLGMLIVSALCSKGGYVMRDGKLEYDNPLLGGLIAIVSLATVMTCLFLGINAYLMPEVIVLIALLFRWDYCENYSSQDGKQLAKL